MDASESFQALLRKCVTELQGIHGEDLLFVLHFGSTARGSLKHETDLDLFACLRAPLARSTARNAFASTLEAAVEPFVEALALQGYQLHVSLQYRSREGIQTFAPLHLDLATDGILLFDRDGTGAAFVASVKKRIEERGTVRKRIGMKWYWSNV